jgi:hypothetical protein
MSIDEFALQFERYTHVALMRESMAIFPRIRMDGNHMVAQEVICL